MEHEKDTIAVKSNEGERTGCRWIWRLSTKERIAHVVGGLVLVVSFALFWSAWEAACFPLGIPRSWTWVGVVVSALVAAVLAAVTEVFMTRS